MMSASVAKSVAASATQLHIVHELALDPDAFNKPVHVQPGEPGDNQLASLGGHTAVSSIDDLQRAIKNQAYRAFFDQIDARRAEDPKEWGEHMTDLLCEMRDQVIQVIPERLAHKVAETQERFDRPLLLQMLQQDSFDADVVISLFSFTCDLIKAIELPLRIPITEAWWDEARARIADSPDCVPALIPDMFRFVHDKIEQVKHDMFQAQIEILRPIAQSQGPKFEREHWREEDPVQARTWLRIAVSRGAAKFVGRAVPTLAALNAADAAGVAPLVTDACVRDAVYVGVLGLIAEPTPHLLGRLPETVRLDAKRLHDLQNWFQKSIMVGIIISLCNHFDDALPATPALPRAPEAAATDGTPAPSPPSPERAVERPRTYQWLAGVAAKFDTLLSSQEVVMAGLRAQLKEELTQRAAGVPPPQEGQGSAPDVDAAVRTMDSAFNAEHVLYRAVQPRVLNRLFQLLVGDEGAGRGGVAEIYLVACDKVAPALIKMARHNVAAFGDVYREILINVKAATPDVSGE